MFVPKVILVTMFEAAEGPGEMALFRKRWDLEPITLSGLEWLPLFANTEKGILTVLAGVGTANTAVSITALGMCDALDLRESHWLICGIAGVNANGSTLGTVMWADWCVDGDLAFEIDAREIPDDWSSGVIPLGAKKPFGPSSLSEGLFGRPYQVFQLNRELIAFALTQSSSIQLSQTEAMRSYCAQYTESPEATKEPSVATGSVLSAARFWHGHQYNTWAEQWVDYWTKGEGSFGMCAMEDSGTLHAIKTLEQAGRADFEKVLLLRAASNFTTPAPGMSVIHSLVGEDGESEANYPGYLPALENACAVGSALVEAFVSS